MADQQSACLDEEARVVMMRRLNDLVARLEKLEAAECYPRKSYPECPPPPPPKPLEICHPYVPGLKMISRPKARARNVGVTVDGRLAEPFQPKEYYFDQPPLSLPPWFRPRIPSVELRAGVMLTSCDCWKKNGLQDDCRRWDCGRPECRTKPLPRCVPGFDPPIYGVRKANASAPPVARQPAKPILPYPMPNFESLASHPPPAVATVEQPGFCAQIELPANC